MIGKQNFVKKITWNSTSFGSFSISVLNADVRSADIGGVSAGGNGDGGGDGGGGGDERWWCCRSLEEVV